MLVISSSTPYIICFENCFSSHPNNRFSSNRPLDGSSGTSIGFLPNPVYFLHPETNYHEYGVVQKYMPEAWSIKVKDLTGRVFVVHTNAVFIIGKWTAGMEVCHINPLGSVEKCFVAEDARGTESTIKIFKGTFLKTVMPEQLKFSDHQIQLFVSMGDAGRCFMFYSLWKTKSALGTRKKVTIAIKWMKALIVCVSFW